MKLQWNVTSFALFILTLFTVGCSQDLGNSTSTLVLKMPNDFNKSSDVSSLSSKACFAVSITGEKLQDIKPGDCDNSYGEFAGLVGSGQSIELELSRGKNRTIDLFYVVSDSGCENFDPQKGLGQVYGSNKVYHIAHHEGIDMEATEMEIKLQIQWPSSSNTLSALHTTPSSCDVGNDPVNKMVMRDAGVVLGSASRLTQSGNAFMRVRVKNQKTTNINQNKWGARLLPARIGVGQ